MKGFSLLATNPVDIMTRITFELSGFNAKRVLGTGTALDTARLRYLLGQYLSVDPRSIHAFVMGEHGDSEFVPWSQALLSTKPIREVCQRFGRQIRLGIHRVPQRTGAGRGATDHRSQARHLLRHRHDTDPDRKVDPF